MKGFNRVRLREVKSLPMSRFLILGFYSARPFTGSAFDKGVSVVGRLTHRQ